MFDGPCLFDHITLISILSGGKYKGGCTDCGDELSNIPIVLTEEPDNRIYYCSNCNKTFDGRETFEKVSKHLGTFPG